MCTALVVGNTIGMGIFMLPASMAPLGANSLWGWLVTIIGFLLIATVFSFLARNMPNGHGPYGFIRENVGELPAFMTMWCYWISCWVTMPTMAIAIVSYLEGAFPHLALPSGPVFAITLIWIFTVINMRGAVASGKVQIITTVLKLVPLFAVILLGIWVLLTQPLLETPSLASSPVNFGNLMAATTLAVFAMLGIESASVPGEHVHEPDRTIPRATYAGTIFTALIYLSVTAVIMALIPYKQLEHSQAPFVDLLSTYVGNGIGQWLAIFVVISGLGALNGFTLVSSQITRTMAVNGTMPAILGQMNAHHAPAKSLLLGGVLATIMVLMNYSKSLVDAFTFMALIITAANLPLYFFSAIALIRMKNKNAIERFGLFASIAMLALVFVVFAFIGIGLEAFIWIVVLALMALPVYYIMRRTSKKIVSMQG